MSTLKTELDFFSVTPATEAAILADNDLFIESTEIVNFFDRGNRMLMSVAVYDQDDQAVEMDLLFSNAAIDLGTLNGALNPTDAEMLKSCAFVSFVPGTHAIDLVNSMFYYRAGLFMPLKKGANSSLYVSGIVRSGTPDYTATGIVIELGVQR